MSAGRSAAAAVVVAAVAASIALSGCSQLTGGRATEIPEIAASCVPMTVQAEPTPAVAGQELNLDFEHIHATCDDVDPNPGSANEPTTADVGLWEVNGEWRDDSLGTVDTEPDSSGSTAFVVPVDAPAGTYKVMVFGREIGLIEIVSP